MFRIFSARAEYFDDCACLSNKKNDDDLQALDKLLSFVPIPDLYEGGIHDRKKRSVGDFGESWLSRDRRPVGRLEFPSSFTSQMGRWIPEARRSIDPQAQLISFKAGKSFTPRLGRREQIY